MRGKKVDDRQQLNHHVVLVLLDGLRHDFGLTADLGWERVLNPESTNNKIWHGAVREMFGFMTRPAFFAGLDPENSGVCMMYSFSPATSPFRPLRFLPSFVRQFFDSVSPLEHLCRRIITQHVRHSVSGPEHFYATTVEIPLYILPCFDFGEKTFPWEGYQHGKSIFQVLNEYGFKWKYIGYPLVTDYSSDERMAEDFKREVSSDCRFAYIHFSQLDGLGHQYGPDSPQYKQGVKNYQRLLKEIIEHCKEIFGNNFSLLAFGDHGMVKVEHTIDIWSELPSLHLRLGLGKDYVVFLDSTMARFWCFTDRAREKIAAMLSELEGGHLLTKEDYAKYRIRFPDNRYGDLIFLADPGHLIFPNFFQMDGPPPKGMHGYDPDEPENWGAFMLSSPRLEETRAIGVINQVDIFPTVLELLGLPIPKSNQGNSIFKLQR